MATRPPRARQGLGLAGGRATDAGERLRWIDESQSQAGRWLAGAGRSPCRTPTSGQQPSQGWWCSAVLAGVRGLCLIRPPLPLIGPAGPGPQHLETRAAASPVESGLAVRAAVIRPSRHCSRARVVVRYYFGILSRVVEQYAHGRENWPWPRPRPKPRSTTHNAAVCGL